MSYQVISKSQYHMYALGEIVERMSSAELLGTYLYVNDRGIMQRLDHDHVEEVVDTDEKAL